MTMMSSFVPYNHQYIILQGYKGWPRSLRLFHTTISTLYYKGCARGIRFFHTTISTLFYKGCKGCARARGIRFSHTTINTLFYKRCKGCARGIRLFHTTISTLFYKAIRDVHDVFVLSIQPSVHYFTRVKGMSTMSSFVPCNRQYIILQGWKECPRCLRSFHATVTTLFYDGVRDVHDVFVPSIQPSVHYFTRV